MKETMPHDYKEIILIDDAYFTSLITDIQKANNTIDLETYIFKNDEIGKKVALALCDAAERGVRVRLLVDGIGTFTWGNKLLPEFEKAGVLTRVFHPLPWFFSYWHPTKKNTNSFTAKILYLLSKMNTRNHRKVCIIDKHIVYIGSANITQYYFTYQHSENSWRETSVKLVGAKIDDLSYAFEKAWGHIPIRKRLRLGLRKIKKNPVFLLNYSWRRRHLLYQALLNRISNCKERIWITNAYFVPDNYLLRRLIRAARHGVDVRILLPHKSDVMISSIAATTFYKILLKNGVAVYEYMPSMLHAKMLILDDWFCVGSSNLNHRSLRHDLEVDVNIRTPHAQAILEHQFHEDIKQSKKLNLADIKKQPFYISIIGRWLLIVRHWI